MPWISPAVWYVLISATFMSLTTTEDSSADAIMGLLVGEETTSFPDFLVKDGLVWEDLARVEPANEFLRVGIS